ncbi:MAG: hypothetical protein ABIG35_15815 [Pseudomonadota bacterium]
MEASLGRKSAGEAAGHHGALPLKKEGLISSLRTFQMGCKHVVCMVAGGRAGAGFHFLTNFPVDRGIGFAQSGQR